MTAARRIGPSGGTTSRKTAVADHADQARVRFENPAGLQDHQTSADEDAQVHSGQADQVQKPGPAKGLVRVAVDVVPLAQQQGFDHGLALGFGERMAQQPSGGGVRQRLRRPIQSSVPAVPRVPRWPLAPAPRLPQRRFAAAGSWRN